MERIERRQIVINYRPREQFTRFHNRTQRWSVIVGHRRLGKTVACTNDLIKRSIEELKPDGRYAYVAPYFNQAKDAAWDYLKRFSRPLQSSEPNESELRVDLINGSRIRLYGADNPDRLRGPYLDGVVLDEHAYFRSGVWSEVIRPMLADRKGWAVFIGTPAGKNEFFDVYQNAWNNPEWYCGVFRASETGLISPIELASIRADMTQDEYDQEFECSFDAAVRGAFFATELRRLEDEKRLGKVPIDRAIKIHTAWDLGVTDSTAIWFIQAVGRERRLVDYYETSGVGLPHYAQVLKDKGYLYGEHFFPHDIAHKELSTGLSRVETLRGLGIEPRVVPVHNVLDGINATRRMLDRCWVDEERCARGYEALKQYRREYDDKLKDWKNRPLHDWTSHGADALRTFAAGFDEPQITETKDRHRRDRKPEKSAWAA